MRHCQREARVDGYCTQHHPDNRDRYEGNKERVRAQKYSDPLAYCAAQLDSCRNELRELKRKIKQFEELIKELQ